MQLKSIIFWGSCIILVILVIAVINMQHLQVRKTGAASIYGPDPSGLLDRCIQLWEDAKLRKTLDLKDLYECGRQCFVHFNSPIPWCEYYCKAEFREDELIRNCGDACTYNGVNSDACYWFCFRKPNDVRCQEGCGLVINTIGTKHCQARCRGYCENTNYDTSTTTPCNQRLPAICLQDLYDKGVPYYQCYATDTNPIKCTLIKYFLLMAVRKITFCLSYQRILKNFIIARSI